MPNGNSMRLGNPTHTLRYANATRRKKQRGGGFITRKEIRGGKMNVPSNPPSIHYQPWMPLTVVHSGISGEITIKVKDLVAEIKGQIDPTKHALVDYPILNIRLRSVRAWNLTGRMIALTVDDFSDASKAIADVDALCGLVDTGSSTHIPAIGYEMPESHKNIVLRNGNDTSSDRDVVLYHLVCPSTDTCIMYTSILWKFDGPATFSAFHDAMLTSVQQIERSMASTSSGITKLVELEEKVCKGDFGKLLIDGIEKVAPYVIAPITATTEERLIRIERLLLAVNLDDASIISSSELEIPPEGEAVGTPTEKS